MNTDTQQLEALQDDAKLILPVYIAVDHSWSMSKQENDAIDEANALIPTIIDTCIKNPLADERARFCIIGFNDRAEVVSPMARGTNLAPHTFAAESGTSFTALFTVLREQIAADYARFEADGFRVYRPAVFLITDGEPICDAGDRAAAFDALTDPNSTFSPNLSVFGVGRNVPEHVVTQYKSRKGRAFLTSEGSSAAEALGGFIGLLMGTIISAAAQGPSDSAGADGDDFPWDDDAIADEDMFIEIES